MEEEIFSNPEQETKDVLSFEEFTRREPLNSETPNVKSPKYNNFVIYFFDEGSIAGPFYQKAEFFKRFQKEHPELEQKLHEDISQGKKSSDWQKSEPDLYEAYKIMRGYGASDSDLFT